MRATLVIFRFAAATVLLGSAFVRAENSESFPFRGHGSAGVAARDNVAGVDWGTSGWIGYTDDDRPQVWSARDVTFNKPPTDIWNRKPTAKKLRARRRQAFLSPLLRTTFDVDKPIWSAQVVVCGLGLYEFHLNGRKVGDHVLDPAQTSYDKRAFYVRHEVTELIRKGPNAIGLWLGNGFYSQNIAFAPDLSYGAPRARLVLEITYRDGTTERVQSDPSWVARTGPILFDNLYVGETFDARRMPDGWSRPELDASSWKPTEVMAPPTTTLVEQTLEPMRKIRSVAPVSVRSVDEDWIVDMGENMTGWISIRVNQPAGTILKLRFTVHLMPDRQSIDTASTGIHATGGEQTDIYICRGGGEEVWEPRLTYHGFRYVQIEGLKGSLRPEDITG
jgi:alpha-L-rhamnosidase